MRLDNSVTVFNPHHLFSHVSYLLQIRMRLSPLEDVENSPMSFPQFWEWFQSIFFDVNKTRAAR